MSTPATTAAVTPRRSGEPAGEDADPAIGGHRLPDALGQRVAEACQGDRGPGAAPLGQGLIQPQGTEQRRPLPRIR